MKRFPVPADLRREPDEGAPLVLDAFCGPGGMSAGLHRAGFRVLGVDIVRQRRYPFGQIVWDVFDFLPALLDTGRLRDIGVAAIVGSPTCNDHSYLSHTYGREHGSAWQLDAFRELATATGLPWVMENVEGAPMRDPVTLCGSMFDLPAVPCADGVLRQVRRHRQFEGNVPLTAPSECWHVLPALGVHGGGPKVRAERSVEGRGGYQGTAEERRAGMDMSWATRDECSLAVPPAYGEHVGRALLAELHRRRSA